MTAILPACSPSPSAQSGTRVARLRTFSTGQLYAGEPWPSEPFVFKFRSFDIPVTIARALANLPPSCVAIGLGAQGGPAMVQAAERVARRRGLRILWRNYRG